MHRAAAELLSQAVVHPLCEAVGGIRLAALELGVVEVDVGDPPLHERIHEKVLLLHRQEELRIRVHRLDTRVELAHVIDEGLFEPQARIAFPRVGLDDLTESEDDGAFALVDGEDRHQAHGDHHGQDDECNNSFRVHRCYPLPSRKLLKRSGRSIRELEFELSPTSGACPVLKSLVDGDSNVSVPVLPARWRMI